MNPRYMDVTIPEKIIIGVTNRNKSVVTKYEEGKAGKAKMNTLRRRMKIGTTESIIDNVPYTGFVIDKINYNEWSVKDPRGFEVRLSEHNVLTLLKQCVIDKGEIVSKCTWAWRRSLFLVSLDDPDYQQIVDNGNQDTSNLIKAKDLNIGDVVKDKYNNTLTYRGKFYQLSFGFGSLYDDSLYTSTSKKFWFTDNHGNVFQNSGSIQLTRISESKPENRDELKNYKLVFDERIKTIGRCGYIPIIKKTSIRKTFTTHLESIWSNLEVSSYFRDKLNSIKILEVAPDELYIIDTRSQSGADVVNYLKRYHARAKIPDSVRLPMKSYTEDELKALFATEKTFKDKVMDSSQKYSNTKVLTANVKTRSKLDQKDITGCKVYNVECMVFIEELNGSLTIK